MPPYPKMSGIQPTSHLLNKTVTSAKTMVFFPGKNQNNSRLSELLGSKSKEGEQRRRSKAKFVAYRKELGEHPWSMEISSLCIGTEKERSATRMTFIAVYEN